MKLDEKDRSIITLYGKNPEISQEEIAREIGLSQSSVAIRVKKLRKSGALITQTGINPLKMGLYMVKVDVVSENTHVILEMTKDCPYFANGFTVSGKYNLCLFYITENIATLEAMVNNHIRSHPSVTDVAFNIVIGSEKDVVVPVSLTAEISNMPPCGVHPDCEECISYKAEKCKGCPAIGNQKGWLY